MFSLKELKVRQAGHWGVTCQLATDGLYCALHSPDVKTQVKMTILHAQNRIHKPIQLRPTTLIKGPLRLLKYLPSWKQNLGHGTFISKQLSNNTLFLREKVPLCDMGTSIVMWLNSKFFVKGMRTSDPPKNFPGCRQHSTINRGPSVVYVNHLQPRAFIE